MNRHLLGLAGFLILATGCAENSLKATNDRALDNGAAEPGALLRQLRLDVFPGQTVDANGAVRALPQTTPPFDATEVGQLDVGLVELRAPGSLSGFVTGELATPWADGAELPSTAGPIDATVRIALPGTVQNYTADTEDGIYDAIVVPSDLPYLVSVIPDEPGIPFATAEIAFREAAEQLDFELGYGVALYGRVLTGNDEPVQNARIHAIDQHGIASAVTRTDAGGWYVMRVQEDAPYTVVSSGRDPGRDPVLRSPVVMAEPVTGNRVDFRYPSLAGTFATGRVVDADGFAVSDVTVRFTATSLDGYADLDATLELEDITDANGNFEASLLDGTYDVAFLPPTSTDPAQDHGALVLEGRQTDAGGLVFGNQTLPDLQPFGGEVVDVFGNSLASAQITCSEIDLSGRSWTAFSGKSGRFDMMLPPGPARCVVQPPGDRIADLAWTTEQIDASIDDGHQFEVREGTLVAGAVQLNGTGEPYALVEVRDGNGTVLGAAVTRAEETDLPVGGFQVRVDLPEGL